MLKVHFSLQSDAVPEFDVTMLDDDKEVMADMTSNDALTQVTIPVIG
jgi:hypothetical protein